jgi:hypothetical protein
MGKSVSAGGPSDGPDFADKLSIKNAPKMSLVELFSVNTMVLFFGAV